ncbi:MAG: hypothetical protein ABSE16_03790 [Verrucomicrobiota bacterium]
MTTSAVLGLIGGMAYTFTGTGTTFYGKRDFRTDGTFLTTEWVSIVYFPIFPIRSLRVFYQGPAERRFPFGVGWSESYAVHEKLPPNLRQVFYVYGYAFLTVGWMLLLIELCVSAENAIVAFSLLFAGSLLPVLAPWSLRFYARRKSHAKPITEA